MQIVRRIPRTSRVVLPNDPHHVDFLFEKIFEKILCNPKMIMSYLAKVEMSYSEL